MRKDKRERERERDRGEGKRERRRNLGSDATQSVFSERALREDHAADKLSLPSALPSSSSSSPCKPNQAQLRSHVSEHHHHGGRAGEGLHLRALLRVHRVLLGAPLLQPPHQLDHRARGAAPDARALRAGLPPARVRPGLPGHERPLLPAAAPGRAAGPRRLRAHGHRPDQQRLQHPADAHGDGPGPLLRRVPPDALHRHLRRGPLALAAGRAHLAGGPGHPAQSAPPAGPRGRRRRARLSRGVRPGAAEERRAAEGGVHRRVHGAHTVQLRAHTRGGAAAGGGQQAQPGRLQDDRPARHPAGRVHPPQLRELRADDAAQTRLDPDAHQGAVGRGRLRLLQLGAVHCAGRLRAAQRGTAGEVESPVPLLFPTPEERAGLDRAGQLATAPPKNTGANADSPDEHLPRGPTSPSGGGGGGGGGDSANVSQEFLK